VVNFATVASSAEGLVPDQKPSKLNRDSWLHKRAFSASLKNKEGRGAQGKWHKNILQTSSQGYCGPHSGALLVAQIGMFNCKLLGLNNNHAVGRGHLFDGPNQPRLSTLWMCSDSA